VHHYFDTAANHSVHCGAVTDVGLDEFEVFIFETVGNVAAFNFRVVEIIEIIDPHHLQTFRKESIAEMRTNETRCSSNKYFHNT